MSRIKNIAFDTALGGRIRQARASAGVSQSVLADRLGVSFQQVQKYEKGIDRISVETLLKVSAALALPPDSFLDAETVALAGPIEAAGEPTPDARPDPMAEAA